jgi:hypothetical protein
MSSMSSGACPVSTSAPPRHAQDGVSLAADFGPGCGGPRPPRRTSQGADPRAEGRVGQDRGWPCPRRSPPTSFGWHGMSGGSHEASVESTSADLRLTTISPRVMVRCRPENVECSRLAPLAMPRMMPCSRAKRETVWLVSDQSHDGCNGLVGHERHAGGG